MTQKQIQRRKDERRAQRQALRRKLRKLERAILAVVWTAKDDGEPMVGSYGDRLTVDGMSVDIEVRF